MGRMIPVGDRRVVIGRSMGWVRFAWMVGVVVSVLGARLDKVGLCRLEGIGGLRGMHSGSIAV